MITIWKCEKCGKEVSSEMKYCPGCGAENTARQDSPVVPQPPVLPGATVVAPVSTMQYQQAKVKRKGLPRGAKIGLIAAGIAIVVIVVAVVAFLLFFVETITKPADVANAYVKALDEGNLSTAWGDLSKKTQEEEGRENFNSQKKPFEGNIEKWNVHKVEVRPGNASVDMTLRLDNGDEANWYFYLVKENGDYKIRVVSETPLNGINE